MPHRRAVYRWGLWFAMPRTELFHECSLLTQGTGTLPIDQIKEGMFLEAQHDVEPDLVWPVKVIENVGGRLLLRYEAAETAAGDFWLFYLHHRLHPIGWARSHDCTYRPPAGLSMQLYCRKTPRNVGKL